MSLLLLVLAVPLLVSGYTDEEAGVFIHPSGNVELCLGQEARIECTSHNAVGCINSNVKMTKGDEDFTSKASHATARSAAMMSGQQSAYQWYYNQTWQKDGQYDCTADFIDCEGVEPFSLTTRPSKSAHITYITCATLPDNKINAQEGQDVEIRCKSKSPKTGGVQFYQWFKDGEIISPEWNGYSFLNDNEVLKIEDIGSWQEAKYTCMHRYQDRPRGEPRRTVYNTQVTVVRPEN